MTTRLFLIFFLIATAGHSEKECGQLTIIPANAVSCWSSPGSWFVPKSEVTMDLTKKVSSSINFLTEAVKFSEEYDGDGPRFCQRLPVADSREIVVPICKEDDVYYRWIREDGKFVCYKQFRERVEVDYWRLKMGGFYVKSQEPVEDALCKRGR